MLPRVKRIASLLLISLLLLLSSCKSSQDSHYLCEFYEPLVEWGYYTRESAPNDVETYARFIAQDPDSFALCAFDIIAVKNITQNSDMTCFDLIIKIRSVLAGNPFAFITKEIVVPARQTNKSFYQLIGKRYISFINRNNLGTYFLCPNPMCLIVEGDTLVSPMGCAFEEEEDRYGFECRNYTGQKLGYYVKLVKDAIKEYEAQ